jgi:hypothetical protein
MEEIIVTFSINKMVKVKKSITNNKVNFHNQKHLKNHKTNKNQLKIHLKIVIIKKIIVSNLEIQSKIHNKKI